MGDSASLLDPAGGSEEGECIWREIDDWHMKVFQKAPSKWAQRWRKASLAINALNQWRLVVESNQPVNKGKGTQVTNPAVTSLSSLFHCAFCSRLCVV